MNYESFIKTKTQWQSQCGFKCNDLPDCLYDFQKYLVEWALGQGRGAIFADCGLGKTIMQLAWAEKVIERTNKPVLILTPLAVGQQTMLEAEHFGIEAKRSRDGVIDDTKCIWITNYEQLHKFDQSRFSGVVCDESSCIKDFKSARKQSVVDFMRTIEFRLLCTATAAPNDFWELGTSSEALGLLGFRDMITKFFKQETSKDHLGWGRTKYRFRGHAQEPFWSWVCSWARSLRNPDDLGFDGSAFVLPPLIETNYIVETNKPRDGMLFSFAARNLDEQRAERRNSITERCEQASEFVLPNDPTVFWCELNDEANQLEKLIPDSKQVSGSMSDEKKEELLIAFSTGELKHLITKPKIGAWGLNWQHCNNIVSFPSHSFERYYQSIRRCWRFGQKRPVDVRVIVNEGESAVIKSLQRKSEQATVMFESIVAHMHNSMHLASNDFFPEKETIPSWLDTKVLT